MRTRVEINRKNLVHNLETFRKKSLNRKVLFAVKSNAYGHGLFETVSTLKGSGLIDCYGVDSIEEANSVKEADPSLPILILGWLDSEGIKEAVKNGYDFVAPSIDFLKKVDEIAGISGFKAKLHLKLDTGTTRLGMNVSEMEKLLKSFPFHNIHITGFYSHYANIEDTTDHSFATLQRKQFEKFYEKPAFKDCISHFSCSAAALLFPETYYDMIRVGISGYGMWPSKQTLLSYRESGRNDIELKPVLSWYSKVAQVKKIKKGTPVSYGLTYKAFNDTMIAVIPVGYYDGYDRKLSNISTVIINGNRAPVRGRICMNMLMAEVSHIKNIRQGDEVILIGSDNGESITAEELGELAGTINYEVVTRIASHIPRVVI